MLELFFLNTKTSSILFQGMWFAPVSPGLLYKQISRSAWAPPSLVPSVLVLSTHCRAELLHWLVGEPITASDLINYMLLYL